MTAFLLDDKGWYILKDPAANLEYDVEWIDWLAGDTILTSVFTVATGLTQGAATNTASTARVWLSGGTLGVTYIVSNAITTAGVRADNREFRVVIVNL